MGKDGFCFFPANREGNALVHYLLAKMMSQQDILNIMNSTQSLPGLKESSGALGSCDVDNRALSAGLYRT